MIDYCSVTLLIQFSARGCAGQNLARGLNSLTADTLIY